MRQILPGVFAFSGLMVGRAYLITEGDGLTLIDTSMPGAGKKILAQLEAAGHRPADVQRILITHAHYDHIGGLPDLEAAMPNAQVIASAVEKPFIADGAPMALPNRQDVPPLARLMIPRTASANLKSRVDRTVVDCEVLPEVLGGLQVIATPGHSPGHVSYWQPDRRILFTGDVMMNIPFGLRLPFAAFTTSMKENIRSIRKVAALEPEALCFGHGPAIVSEAGARVKAFAARLPGG
ncbi:MAG: MBL fold metallo-hydrolase [Chloroflexi bacterium]|nr:MBL fold metallo-hydrolase [Chloroflexota bacterium]